MGAGWGCDLSVVLSSSLVGMTMDARAGRLWRQRVCMDVCEPLRSVRSSSEGDESSCFASGVEWCPDGTCLLTCISDSSGGSEAHRFVIEDLEGLVDGTEWSPRDCSDESSSESGGDEMRHGLELSKQDAVYSYAWFPCASCVDDSSFCFASSGRGHPVHIYDGFSGRIRGSYVAMDATRDEMVSVYSVAFSGTGQYLYGGGMSTVHVFDVTRPGKYSDGYLLKSVDDAQEGIISSVVPGIVGTALEHVVAVGSYGKYGAGLHDIRSREMICLLEGHRGGVTHMEFSVDGNYLYTGARKDGSLFCWDARYLTGAVYTIRRESTRTNQKIYFDVEPSGRHLASGGDDGRVSIYDLRDGKPVSAFQAAPDCVNGCQFHPSEALLATSHGERRFSSPDIDSDEESQPQQQESSHLIGLWAFDTCNLTEETC